MGIQEAFSIEGNLTEEPAVRHGIHLDDELLELTGGHKGRERRSEAESGRQDQRVGIAQYAPPQL